MVETRAMIASLADAVLSVHLDLFPVESSLLGLPGRDAVLPDHSVEAEQTARAELERLAADARRIDSSELDTDDAVTVAVVVGQSAMLTADIDAQGVEWCVADYYVSPVTRLLTDLPMVSLDTVERADGYLARLELLPNVLETLAARHRRGIVAGRTPLRRHVDALVTRLDRLLAGHDADPLARPAPSADSGVDVASFAARRDRMLGEVVHPSLRAYRELLVTDVRPHGRSDDQPGVCWIAGGEQIYIGLIAANTTIDTTADELHRLGVRLIDELDDEYIAIGGTLFDTRDPTEIRRRLSEDPAMHWANREELLDVARATIARAEAAAPDWFGLLPTTSCVVQPVPAEEAPGASPAYYLAPALDGSRPGTYFANCHLATERERFSAESTAFHEAVPGHHLQLSIAQELTAIPLLRRALALNAYVEGWGLYAERLADEMGLYSDPIARLGMLALDSMRAARLVVDTGLHAHGWTRQQAVDYLTAHTLMPAVEIQSETDRYIAHPGQALSYMVGRIHIQQLRTSAEQQLHSDFDIRSFHDVILGHGSMPLRMLTNVVERWISAHPTPT
jgi:uncharacterized protein (DUF885 family)